VDRQTLTGLSIIKKKGVSLFLGYHIAAVMEYQSGAHNEVAQNNKVDLQKHDQS
jgi:hypothetical protein